MSTQENKVEVITEFLRNRASLGRVTTVQEIQRVAAEMLVAHGYRDDLYLVDRDVVNDVLNEIAKASFAEQGFILPAIVVHFADDEPPSRFIYQAVNAGLLTDEAVISEQAAAAFAEQKAKVFAKYQSGLVIPDSPEGLDAEV
jgi:hypothetical protein